MHNPGCILENNPHYALYIHRTTDVRISVSQADSRGRSSGELLPVSILIVKNLHHKVPMRLQQLTKENVVCRTEEPKSEKNVFLYATLKPGLYIVLVPAYISGMVGNFTIKCLSNYRAKLDPVWPPKWMLKGESKGSGQMAIEDAAGRTKETLNNYAKYGQSALAALFGGGDHDLSDDEGDGEAAAQVKENND